MDRERPRPDCGSSTGDTPGLPGTTAEPERPRPAETDHLLDAERSIEAALRQLHGKLRHDQVGRLNAARAWVASVRDGVLNV